MNINKNSSLLQVAQALIGTWQVTKEQNTTILEAGQLRIVRVRITEPGSIILPIRVTEVTPYHFYTRNEVKGGTLNSNDISLHFDETGVLEYILVA